MAAALHATSALPSRLRSQVWQGDQLAGATAGVVPSGYAALDALLPGKGWPAGSLTELLVEHGGIGEMRLVAPALKSLTARDGKHVVFVAPPWQPYACALKVWGIALERVVWVRAREEEAPWAAEQALKQEGMGAVLVWLAKARPDAVRRLQVVAQDSRALAFLVRPAHARSQSSAAPLRIACEPMLPPDAETIDRHRWLQEALLSVDVFKRRGPPPARPLFVTLPLQAGLLPPPQSQSGHQRQWHESNHVVDRSYLAPVAAGGGEAASGSPAAARKPGRSAQPA
ncbi:translesion DNA synthesis-associated protein ImuA [Paraburkholderia kururiensis]|uniref:translesion DNA synthesis-associated protein ImuA n=1 Tax=Paraburkholderia kururiensis TaxID=984307 RepID=UPI000F896111|nr:translesion DNA synthesis-associated protein ImuA [Paraburkholderia kururiensis]